MTPGRGNLDVLRGGLRQHPALVVAYSGGADSAFLAVVASQPIRVPGSASSCRGSWAMRDRTHEGIRRDLRSLLDELKASGNTIAGYGAAAKGSTLLNYTGVDTALLDYVVDRNVHKHGLHMPGVHVPIRSPETLHEEMPDYVLLVAWNYRDEVMRQQREYLERGGRFIVPVPSPEIL